VDILIQGSYRRIILAEFTAFVSGFGSVRRWQLQIFLLVSVEQVVLYVLGFPGWSGHVFILKL
jgi:hypothetical protein